MSASSRRNTGDPPVRFVPRAKCRGGEGEEFDATENETHEGDQCSRTCRHDRDGRLVHRDGGQRRYDHPLQLVGRSVAQREDRQDPAAVREGQSRRPRHPRAIGLAAALGQAEDPGRRRQSALHHPDADPLAVDLCRSQHPSSPRRPGGERQAGYQRHFQGNDRFQPRRRRQSLHDPVGRVLFRPDVQQVPARRRRRRGAAR